MSTTIRLRRGGTKKRPFYHLVVTDSRSPRDSKFIEKIGTYNPLEDDEKALVVNKERALAWIKTGAQVSDRIKSLFSTIDLTQCS